MKQAAYGAVYGALAGDAAGATLEFGRSVPSSSEVDGAMKMIGGGIWKTAPGQITDDGEMMLCLMRALAGRKTFDIEEVARQYLRWIESMPFDIGGTTTRGLKGGLQGSADSLHRGMWESARKHNLGSKANGALMRIAPLGVWGFRIPEAELVDAARSESRLTHPNPTCGDASALYCIAIRHLVLEAGDGEGAVRAARRWADRLGNREVSAWLEDAMNGVDVGYAPQIGFVKYGFTHAFRHLAAGTGYAESLRETLSGGGDTDTNACIVGGLVGARVGEEGIPENMKKALLSCDTTRGRERPEFLQTRAELPGLIDALLGGVV
jgi:ADP-ribosylglycohydrolase